MSLAKNSRRSNITLALSCAMALASLNIGCTEVPPEVQPIGPVDCNDLVAHAPALSRLADNTPVVPGEFLLADEGFKIRWFAEYVRGFGMNYLGFTGDYVARVTIEQGGVEVFFEEIDATPMNVASGAYDEVLVPSGLPAGDYLIRIALDVNGEVDQCNELMYALNNVSERAIHIAAEPIDDVATPASGWPNDGGGSGPRSGQSR